VFTIKMDSREPDKIEALLKQKGFVVERVSLPVGDYQIGDFLVERKDINDFYNSLYSSRIWSQLYGMKQSGCKCFLVVVGESPYTGLDEKKLKSLFAVFASCLISYSVVPLWLRNTSLFVLLLEQLAKFAGKRSPSLPPVKHKSTDPVQVKADMLSSIPGIGAKLALELAKQYSIKELCLHPVETLQELEVCGRRLGRRGEQLHRYLTI